MDIGVFGDSFCEKTPLAGYPSWFELLESHGHTVTSYGSRGSSILYSARLLYDNYYKHHFLIWCVTNSPRISIPVKEPPGHLHFPTPLDYPDKRFGAETRHKIDLANDWFKYLMDLEDCNLIGRALVSHSLREYHNLMVIPCFPEPLTTEFNLYDLCSKEAQAYFPGKDLLAIQETHQDLRRCHLSQENNQKLADIVAANLEPGVFQTDYANFVTPTADVSTYFRKY